MLAERLREVRESRHMSATHLAAAAHVSKSFISQLESGRTSASIATLERLAGALGVPVGTLLSNEPARAAAAPVSEPVEVLHSLDLLPGVSRLRLLSDATLGAHATLTLRHGTMAHGTTDGAGLILTVLRGDLSLQAGTSVTSLSAGEIAQVRASCEYDIANDGPGPAVGLVSARSERDLPHVLERVEAAPQELGRDSGGPLRLVAMRARRAAEQVRSR